jgi:hypothetical protein
MKDQRRSHPHPQSDLVAHGTAVAAHMQTILVTNLVSTYLSVGCFLADIIGCGHDLLKDTAAFQAHLDGAASNHLSRHSGGSAVLAYLITREILRQKPDLLANLSFRPLLSHIVFSVIAAHHSRLKQTDIGSEHAESIHHWQKTRSRASEVLVQQVIAGYKVEYAIDQLDRDLAELEKTILSWISPRRKFPAKIFSAPFCFAKCAWEPSPGQTLTAQRDKPMASRNLLCLSPK